MKSKISPLLIVLQACCFIACNNREGGSAMGQDEFKAQLHNKVERIVDSLSGLTQIEANIVIKDSAELFMFTQNDTAGVNLQFSYKRSNLDTNKVITGIDQASNFCLIKGMGSNKDSFQIVITAFKGKSPKAVNQFAKIYKENNLSVKEIEHSLFIENDDILYKIYYQGRIFDNAEPASTPRISTVISILRDTL